MNLIIIKVKKSKEIPLLFYSSLFVNIMIEKDLMNKEEA